MFRASLFLALALIVVTLAKTLVQSDAEKLVSGEARPITRLVDEERASEITVAAIKIREPKTGANWLFVRSRGIWRCATAFAAVCDADLISELLNNFTEARGVLRTRDDTRADEYGFGDEHRFEVSFHGAGVMSAPDEDRLLAFEVGHALPGARHGRSFVRRAGEPDILEIDRNSRELLTRAERSSLPPLLDRRLLGGPWEGRPLGFARITVTRPGSETVIEYADLGPDEIGPDGATWTWRIREGETQGEANPYIGLGFTAFLLHSTYSGFANPKDTRELGLLPAAARVKLEPRSGEVIDLVVGKPSPEGVSYILHEQHRMLMQIDAETARLIAPTASMLLEEANPWELWLSLLGGKR